MFKLSAGVCPFCQAASLTGPKQALWRSSRGAATLQKRKPSRMVLSDKVARSAPKPTASGTPVRKSRNSPWASTNVTTPPRTLQREQASRNSISAAEQKRVRGKYGNSKDQAKDSRTRDPMKALKMQRALVNVPYEKRGLVKQDLLDHDSFDDFKLLESIIESLGSVTNGNQEDVVPTPVQRLAIPALLGREAAGRRKRGNPEKNTGAKGMEQFLLAAETGSGKTLAYVLPIVDAIKRAEASDAQHEEYMKRRHDKEGIGRGSLFELEEPRRDEPHPTTGRPRAIILVPTSELVAQVGSLLKGISHHVKFRSAMISATFSGTVIRNRLFSPDGIDVVVSTPHLLSSITESDPNVLSRVTHLVIDEADSLLDRSFSPITQGIIDRATPSLQKLIMCSATIPKSLDGYLHKRFPEVRRLVTPNLHAIPRRVQLSVIDIEKVPYQGNRNLACAQTVWDIGKEAQEGGDEKAKKIVVFVNEREKTIELATFLRGKGIDALALSRDSDERKQAEVLRSFTGTPGPSSRVTTSTAVSDDQEKDATASSLGFALASNVHGSRSLSNTKVLVMTDLGSRGIDTLLVKHVILYDVPHTSIDFIHRLGRVGRMGRRGRGIVLVGRNDRKDIVREVREGMFKGQALI